MCPLPCGFILDEMERERTRGRTVGCMCGHRVEGTDDADLRRLVRMHVDRVHPEFAYTGEQIRRWVASAARDAVPDGPFSPAVDGRRR